MARLPPQTTSDRTRPLRRLRTTLTDSNTRAGRVEFQHGSGAGDDVRPGVCGMTHGVRLVCCFVGTGRRVTGGTGDKRSWREQDRQRDQERLSQVLARVFPSTVHLM